MQNEAQAFSHLSLFLSVLHLHVQQDCGVHSALHKGIDIWTAFNYLSKRYYIYMSVFTHSYRGRGCYTMCNWLRETNIHLVTHAMPAGATPTFIWYCPTCIFIYSVTAELLEHNTRG